MKLLRQPSTPKSLPFPPVIRPGTIAPRCGGTIAPSVDESRSLNADSSPAVRSSCLVLRAAARVRFRVQTQNRPLSPGRHAPPRPTEVNSVGPHPRGSSPVGSSR